MGRERLDETHLIVAVPGRAGGVETRHSALKGRPRVAGAAALPVWPARRRLPLELHTRPGKGRNGT